MESEKNENIPGLLLNLWKPKTQGIYSLSHSTNIIKHLWCADTGIILWAKQILSPQYPRIHGLYLCRV